MLPATPPLTSSTHSHHPPTHPPHLQELWQLLISANETGTGIPQRFLDEKAEEMRRAKEEAERLQVGAEVGACMCGQLGSGTIVSTASPGLIAALPACCEQGSEGPPQPAQN